MTWVDDGNEDARRAERRGERDLIPARGLHHDEPRRQLPQPQDKTVYPILVPVDSPRIAGRTHRHVHPLLGNIDPYKHWTLLLGPSLQIRALWPRQLFGL